ncbi:unnamed protein product [Adineta steineri]|uniref:Ubiquitin conjugation factor E4 A n=3 Tax=Adineta steineri TaxID=433720 RepID=A0A818YUB0_9BILA|nr:unnamed protein product [Adineta steineri]CAF3757611.1 unnamed protein product [Adineta steineri]
MPETSSVITTIDSILYKDIVKLVLLCTINEEPSISSSSTVYLTELASLDIKEWTKSRVDQALFERLRLSDPSSQLITTIRNEILIENRCLFYVSDCYQRLLRERNYFQIIFDDIQKLLIDHSTTAILLPDMYNDQDLSKQWLELLIASHDNSLLCKYTDHVNNELLLSSKDEIKLFYKNVFRHMYKAIQPLDYFSNELISYIDILMHLSQWSVLVQIIFEIPHPKTISNRSTRSSDMQSAGGRAFQDTLIGSLLSKSTLPSMPGRPFIYFDKPKSMNERDLEITTRTICQPMKIYQDYLSRLFKVFVKNADVRNNVLQWIGDCFYENQGKNKEWSSHDPLIQHAFVSDGFLLNLNIVLLNLVKPFAEPYSTKLLKINPLYSICQNETVHLKELYKETRLINYEGENKDEIMFNFITESFYMSHLCYSYSVHRLHRILLKISEELSRIRDAIKSHGINHENFKRLEKSMQKGLTVFFNIKCVLNEPCLLELSNALFTATCTWLVHLAVCPNQNKKLEEQIHVITKLPLTSEANQQLSYVPEFIIENIIGFIKFINRYNKQYFQSIAPSIKEYVDLILVFMGDANRLRNPHLRASLAEVLETILPDNDNRTLNNSFAETIFKEHPLIEHLPRVLLDVFVSIELTGQAVAFEQKFSYRRPMYEILEYMWKFDKHRIQIQKLASYAEQHIEDAEAPLFLRFINLLMNDANFLLDEALTYMARLKQNQEGKERDEWNQMSERQREEFENTFRHTGQIARYMNIMSIKTLIILNMITQNIQSIFCHPAISERLAAMLNYFLQHLVGPKRRNLKVRDLNEYLFEPSKLVAKVTDIYLNFAEYDQFCSAVSNDGMSYNEQLFPQAIEVLERIRHPRERIDAFLKLGEHIKTIADQHKEDDVIYNDAPEEYIDQISSILMNDPVMLPSSRTILDRSTVIRLLLDNQIDPYTRDPLHMQDVIPQSELKHSIEQWKASRRS